MQSAKVGIFGGAACSSALPFCFIGFGVWMFEKV